MIGIVGAMAEEMNKVVESLTDKKVQIYNNLTFYIGKLNGVEVVVSISGIGKVFAALTVQSMIINFAPKLIINIGAAGSLDSNIHIANVVIGTKACQHDMDVSPIGFAKGEIVGTNTVWFECDKDAIDIFANCAKQLKLNYHLAHIATGDIFVNSNETKNLITKNFDASVAEMEGAAIGQTCFVYKTPFIIIRAISDEADCNSHHDFSNYVEQVTIDALNLIKLAITQL